MNPKRIRSTNWDEEEKLLLRSVLKDYVHIIEDKSLNTNTNNNKTKAWEEVHKKFNGLNCRQRELGQLKIQWKGMKVNARKTYGSYRRETVKTGGGARPPTPDDPAPNANAKKELMKKWLLEKGISVEDDLRKPQLYDLIKKNKDAHKKFTIDELFHANNHSVLRLPPYHPDLNPIEMAWVAIKGHVATKNVEWNIARTMELVKEKVNEMGQAEWSALCRKVIEVEETYRRSDYVIDEMTEQFNTENDTESESESDDDDDAEDENTPQPSTSTSGAEDNFMAGISRIDDYSDSD